ncbi:hypothetical protein PbJCM13498_24480 [Prolixibacter bellariivorans]|uniref:Uncharacterized protein n=1 Tax=Prolixibacter bellariivorans TaxID=314319 RepID=A0A5M4B0A7_9BACT|nr:hypothetical protein PbJCM13498_24480 [Prolixibacter bellariivorans]
MVNNLTKKGRIMKLIRIGMILFGMCFGFIGGAAGQTSNIEIMPFPEMTLWCMWFTEPVIKR